MLRPADAEDVIGQVFFRLLEGLARIDPRRGSVLAYALGAARNALVDQARGRGGPRPPRRRRPRWWTAQRARWSGWCSSEQEARVRAELARLPAQTRELLVLRYADGLRYAEIAQMLG